MIATSNEISADLEHPKAENLDIGRSAKSESSIA
jgi:hypothetical protein